MRLAVVVVLVACRGPAVPAVPSQGGPAWRELASEHFVVWTDASRARGVEMIREMEHLRQVVRGVGFASTVQGDRSFVIALRNEDEVGAYIPESFVAFAFYGALKQSAMLLPADEVDSHVVTHELVHLISHEVIRHQPAWFAEGLAKFFETVNLDPDSAKGDVGAPDRETVAYLREVTPLPAWQMFACKSLRCMDARFYATAWAMFSYLANTRPRELLDYAQRLDEGTPDAWAATFPDLGPNELDHQVRKWLAYGKHTVWRFDVALKHWPIAERVLRDADVYAARAVLLHQFRTPDVAPPELARALAEDPTHLLANLVKVAYDKSIALDTARAVAAAHPADWRAWWLVSRAANYQGDEARVAWEKACVLPQASRDWCKRP